VYAGLCQPEVAPEERAAFLEALDRQDEDGLVALLARQATGARGRRAMAILREARELGERIDILDRTLPALPHGELAGCYARLRELEGEIAGLEAAGRPW